MRVAVPLVFVDTETTGVGPLDEPWEVFLLRRDPDGREEELHLFVEHDETLAEGLPAEFARDRFVRFSEAVWRHDVVTRTEAAFMIDDFLWGGELVAASSLERPHLVGACPWFDAAMIGGLYARLGIEVPWSHHLIDIENLALGVLATYGVELAVPWSSTAMMRRLGSSAVRPVEGRHQARADALWARDVFDLIMNLPVRRVTS